MIELRNLPDGRLVLVLSRQIYGRRDQNQMPPEEGGVHGHADIEFELAADDWHDLKDAETIIDEIRQCLDDCGVPVPGLSDVDPDEDCEIPEAE